MRPRWLHNVQITLYGTLAIFAVVTFACLQPGLQPKGYRTSPVVCPPGELDSRGYCVIFRGGDYVDIGHSGPITLMSMHISRASAPGKDDIITVVGFSQGKFQNLRFNPVDRYPPQNHMDAFVQAVRDRRTELYSDMGWPDPNQSTIPPLNR